jgi:hypothetical protein
MYHSTLTSLSGLRRLLPHRPVTYTEALVVAECQANRLASASGELAGSVEAHDLLKLTPITLEATPPSDGDRHSGSSTYQHGRWIIRLNTLESSARQRFTLAHELKHIIDATNSEAYVRLSDRQIERVCDHFAACLLMSKLSVYRLWGDGVRTPEALARTMRVSLTAITIRLRKLGLPINTVKGRSSRYAARPRLRKSLPPSTVVDDTFAKTEPLTAPNPSGAAP